MVLGGLLLWCNPRQKENKLSWHRDVTWWGTGERYFAQRDERGSDPEAYSEGGRAETLERDPRK